MKAAFCKKTDPFANFHCADNRFCTGSTQKLRVDSCIMKTLHTETVNGGVRRHQDKRFFFQFGKRDRFFGRGGMSFRKNSNQTVCCESMKSIELRVYHVFSYKDQIKKVFFKTGKKFFVFYLLQRKRKLRVCITEVRWY